LNTGDIYCPRASNRVGIKERNLASRHFLKGFCDLVGGNIFATDWYYQAITAKIKVSLTDGSAYVGYSKSAADFIGFISTGASIASITLVASKPNTDVYATIDNMYFGVVPAPGALTLLGLAGLVSRKRR
jgi:hypothetical protein